MEGGGGEVGFGRGVFGAALAWMGIVQRGRGGAL